MTDFLTADTSNATFFFLLFLFFAGCIVLGWGIVIAQELHRRRCDNLNMETALGIDRNRGKCNRPGCRFCDS